MIFGRLFDEIGFGVIPEPLFRDIVLARLVYPTCKLKTADYLFRYRGKTVSAQSIYRFLDRLNEHYSQQAREVAYRHSRTILRSIRVVFYDMTSLYFAAEDEDDLRIRPMHHRRRRRIEAHVLVAFVAYTIYKELERRLHPAKIPNSPQRAAELTQIMYEMTLLQMDEEQRPLHLIGCPNVELRTKWVPCCGRSPDRATGATGGPQGRRSPILVPRSLRRGSVFVILSPPSFFWPFFWAFIPGLCFGPLRSRAAASKIEEACSVFRRVTGRCGV
ncbi:MAG: hypothetical protein R6V12_09755 [Candidatus Hydrogenedentota bacterium]